MAKKTVSTEVKYQLIVSESELELIRTGLRRLYHSEDPGWSAASDLLGDLSEEN